MHYNYHRYYAPENGRYLTADPIGLKGGVNLYVYVQNNPGNKIDPRGLWTASIGTVISGTAFGFGGGGGTFINIGHDSNAGLLSGWSFSITGSAEIGPTAGLGYSHGINFSGTNACSVKQLPGTFIGAGRGGLGKTGMAYFQTPDGTVHGGGFTITTIGNGYTGASAGASTTSTIFQWVQGQGFSSGIGK